MISLSFKYVVIDHTLVSTIYQRLKRHFHMRWRRWVTVLETVTIEMAGR